jgi:hypothetical protein
MAEMCDSKLLNNKDVRTQYLNPSVCATMKLIVNSEQSN